MHFRFLTSTPLNIEHGSGTYTGIATLASFLRMSGETVDLITPKIEFPFYTLARLAFNQMLRFRHSSAAHITVGFDMDGYTLAGAHRGLHVASIKGVIADEMRFESGLTRATMRVQARCEKLHVKRADLVIAPSRYSADRIRDLYSIRTEPRIVPEPIDLAHWRSLLQLNPAHSANELADEKENERFVVLCVCRFYPRKRLHVLLGAADRLRHKIPELEIRVVGDGPEAPRLQKIWREKRLEKIVRWLGTVSQAELAHEYNRCHIFCLPSVQESFGIVFLEAMATGRPIIAARAASIPEVVRHGVLVDPDNDEALAEAITRLYQNPTLRAALAAEASRHVEQFDAPKVAALFVQKIERAPAMPPLRPAPKPANI
jgi:glycosyltransferase involved in cell wall biosynthesis